MPRFSGSPPSLRLERVELAHNGSLTGLGQAAEASRRAVKAPLHGAAPTRAGATSRDCSSGAGRRVGRGRLVVVTEPPRSLGEGPSVSAEDEPVRGSVGHVPPGCNAQARWGGPRLVRRGTGGRL